ncbi:MAG: LON peptidase substrate-binding domain-containing protein [Phycisphaeraceae bacterium]|nr:LON peptidase substrate-binding domain-containing protein [Phycisphaeraceae bacterium]
MSMVCDIDFAKAMPVFPLPRCVLLPHATVPLHVFEPRYRQMTAHALAADKLVAMAVFEGQLWKSDYHGQPPLRPHVCVGYIVRHERLPDGRFNLLLQGICRAKITRETISKPYRKALLEPTETASVMEIDLAEDREKLEKLLRDAQLRELSRVSAIQNLVDPQIPTAALVDVAIATICGNAEEQYAMLAEANGVKRAQWLIEHLRQTRQTLRLAAQLGTGWLDEELSNN